MAYSVFMLMRVLNLSCDVDIVCLLFLCATDTLHDVVCTASLLSLTSYRTAT